MASFKKTGARGAGRDNYARNSAVLSIGAVRCLGGGL